MISLSPKQAELIKKNIIFNENDIKIIQANMKSVDFLDINLNLEAEMLKSYMKPNGFPIDVHCESNKFLR